jgi:folate-binding protein YgfZ
MITDMHVLQGDGLLLLDVPADLAAPLLQRLDQFLFAEDVQLQSLADALTSVWVHGPRAADVLSDVVSGFSQTDGAADAGRYDNYHHERLTFGDSPIVVARIDQLGVPGFCIYVEPARRDALVDALERAGAITVSQDAIDAARIESGYPVFGVDMTDDTIPLEAGIESRAISFSKGCYVGQEVIIRVLHRGGGRVARKLVALRIEGDADADGRRALGGVAKIYSGDREIGFVTSSADSPRFGTIALGYVHRDFAQPGTAVQVDIAGTRTPATVSDRPLSSAA